jgi:TolB-like protein
MCRRNPTQRGGRKYRRAAGKTDRTSHRHSHRDIIIADDDIFGDGVNIAVRLEGIAKPGGVSISDDVHRQIRGKVDITFEDMGSQSLKNIAEPMRVWRARIGPSPSPTMLPNPPTQTVLPLAPPGKPSIAVLPFENMSGDPEQEYFADGMVEDIITGLSRSKSLFVIARTSSFTYKGKAVDIKHVGRELGVRYVLEGSVRKFGNRVRITGQLINAETGAHLWADRFDSQLEDVFDLQDLVTHSVIGAISPQLERAEIERAKRKPTENLQAYDYYLRATASLWRFTREENIEALSLTKIANDLDPEFAISYALGAYCYMQKKLFGWIIDAAQERVEVRRLVRRAIELDKDDPMVLAMAGNALAVVVGEVEEGTALLSRAINLDPNQAAAQYWMGWEHLWRGDVDAAFEHFQAVLRLSPVDPRLFFAQTGIAYAHFMAGRYDEGTSWATSVVLQQPNFIHAQFILAACYAMSGRVEEAREVRARLMQLNPALRISRIKTRYRRAEDIERLEQACRVAGIPE